MGLAAGFIEPLDEPSQYLPQKYNELMNKGNETN